MKKGFTLVELVIVIIIVGILSIVAVPIYKNYVFKAKLTEFDVALSSLIRAEKLYFLENGKFYPMAGISSLSRYNTVLGIDLRNNKYVKDVQFVNYDANSFVAIQPNVTGSKNSGMWTAAMLTHSNGSVSTIGYAGREQWLKDTVGL